MPATEEGSREELAKITQSKGVSLEAKAKITHTFIFLITVDL